MNGACNVNTHTRTHPHTGSVEWLLCTMVPEFSLWLLMAHNFPLDVTPVPVTSFTPCHFTTSFSPHNWQCHPPMPAPHLSLVGPMTNLCSHWLKATMRDTLLVGDNSSWALIGWIWNTLECQNFGGRGEHGWGRGGGWRDGTSCRMVSSDSHNSWIFNTLWNFHGVLLN